jgi:hypothetical protein
VAVYNATKETHSNSGILAWAVQSYACCCRAAPAGWEKTTKTNTADVRAAAILNLENLVFKTIFFLLATGPLSAGFILGAYSIFEYCQKPWRTGAQQTHKGSALQNRQVAIQKWSH